MCQLLSINQTSKKQFKLTFLSFCKCPVKEIFLPTFVELFLRWLGIFKGHFGSFLHFSIVQNNIQATKNVQYLTCHSNSLHELSENSRKWSHNMFVTVEIKTVSYSIAIFAHIHFNPNHYHIMIFPTVFSFKYIVPLHSTLSIVSGYLNP